MSSTATADFSGVLCLSGRGGIDSRECVDLFLAKGNAFAFYRPFVERLMATDRWRFVARGDVTAVNREILQKVSEIEMRKMFLTGKFGKFSTEWNLMR